VFAPLIHLRSRQESHTMSQDHADLCSQDMPENAGGNGACQALLGMIRNST